MMPERVFEVPVMQLIKEFSEAMDITQEEFMQEVYKVVPQLNVLPLQLTVKR
jgi:hypothetical protein